MRKRRRRLPARPTCWLMASTVLLMLAYLRGSSLRIIALKTPRCRNRSPSFVLRLWQCRWARCRWTDEASLNEGCACLLGLEFRPCRLGIFAVYSRHLNDKKELLCRHQKEEPNAQALPPRYVAISFLQR